MAVAKKRSSAKKAAAKKSAVAKKPTKTATATKSAAKKSAAKKSAAKKPAAKKSTAASTSAKKSASKTSSSKPAAKKSAPAKQTEPTVKPAKQAPPKRSRSNEPVTVEIPKARFNKDGFGYTKDFELGFVKEMHDALHSERLLLTGQAKRLEDEAHQLVEEAEMGDVQFDDEGGEGDTMVVERERDLALSAQAREAVEEIDAALDRIMVGTYGYSIVSGRPIPKERLEAIPWSSVLVEEKVGGLGR